MVEDSQGFEKEAPKILQQNRVLFRSPDGISIRLADHPAIPSQEGLHVQVTNDAHSRWADAATDPKIVLEQVFWANLAAKEVARSRNTPDAHSNVHMNARPGLDEGVNVYGRRIDSDRSWRTPVLPQEGLPAQDLPEELVEKLQELSQRYLPRFEPLYAGMELFYEPLQLILQSHAF